MGRPLNNVRSPKAPRGANDKPGKTIYRRHAGGLASFPQPAHVSKSEKTLRDPKTCARKLDRVSPARRKHNLSDPQENLPPRPESGNGGPSRGSGGSGCPPPRPGRGLREPLGAAPRALDTGRLSLWPRSARLGIQPESGLADTQTRDWTHRPGTWRRG